MNREDHEFDQLRRLLKFKRFEQPPPRYFNDFSTHVITRLKAAPGAGLGTNWLQRFWADLELRPVLPAAFGAAICGFLVLAAIYTETNDNTAFTGLTPDPFRPHGFYTDVDSIPVTTSSLNDLLASSTNPVPASSLFDQIRPGLQPPVRVSHPLFK